LLDDAAVDIVIVPDAIAVIVAPGAIPIPVRGSPTVRPRPVVVAGETMVSVVLLAVVAMNWVVPRDTTVAPTGMPGPEIGSPAAILRILDIAVSTGLPLVIVAEGVLAVHGVAAVSASSWTTGMDAVAGAERVIDGAVVVFSATAVPVAVAGAEMVRVPVPTARIVEPVGIPGPEIGAPGKKLLPLLFTTAVSV
jgi:hypothetical protein